MRTTTKRTWSKGRVGKMFVVGALLVSPGLVSRHAAAQSDTMMQGDPVVGSTILLITTACLVGTTVGVVYSVLGSQKNNQAKLKAGRAFAIYLRRNSDQLVADLTLGAGRTVDDLAATAAISTPHAPSFGRLLRANRAEFLKLADVRRLTPERALAFLERMGALVKGDRVLVSDYEVAMAKYGG